MSALGIGESGGCGVGVEKEQRTAEYRLLINDC